MDPISLATAVITIGGLVLTSARFAKSLDEARRFDKDIKKIWRSFSVFAPLMDSVSMSLSDLCRDHADSDVVQYIEYSGLATSLAETSEDIRDQIRVVRTRFEDAAEARYPGRLWWTLVHKPDIAKLYPEMESLKLSLILVQNTINYSTTKDSGKKKRLRQAMRLLENTLITIREEYFSEEPKENMEPVEHARSVTRLALDTNGLLLELSKSMRRSERIPGITPAPAPHARTARQYRRRPDLEIHRNGRETREEILIDPRPPPQELRPTRPFGTNGRTEASPRPRSHVVIPESALRQYEARPVVEHRGYVAEVHRDSMTSARSTLLTRETSSSTLRTTPETLITPLTPGPAASSFTDVREKRNHHSLVGKEGEAVQGYLGAAPGTVVTARRFGMELDENFITSHKAHELGLDMEMLDPEADGAEMVLVVSEGGRQAEKRAIGTAETTWFTSNQPGFTLKMWVLDGQLPDGITIALGRPFEKRRRHYNRAAIERHP